ncbi:hypothetical protein KAU19_05620, partial [Candidatus Parcubacteria bacterium]|nr:hypothetical protein [Candidatus Parcubacteria bacterium]
LELGENLEIKINQISQNLSIEQLLNFIERFIKARAELKGSFIIQLPVELAITALCSHLRQGFGGQAHHSSSEGGQAHHSSSEGGQAHHSSSEGGQAHHSSSEGGQARFSSNINQSNPVAAKPVKTVPTAKVAVSANFNQNQLLAKWNEVLAKVKQHNHSLSFILRVCQPRDLVGNQLGLAFKYKFHKDRVNEPNIKAIIEKILHQVYGLPLTIEAVIDENLQINNNKTVSDLSISSGQVDNSKDGESGLVDNLLKTFGGKVVK